MDADHEISRMVSSRRRLLGAGAVGAGALAFGGLSLDQAMAAGGAGGTTATTELLAAIGPQALPPAIPGARQAVVAFNEVTALTGNGSDTTLSWYYGTYTTHGGFMDIALPVEPGTTVVRVDVYVGRGTSGKVSMTLAATAPDQGGVGQSITTIETTTGTGLLQGSYTTPVVVGPGEKLFLESEDFASSAVTFVGAIVTYFDAKPQLNLLDAPIRVYDSRPPFAPFVGVKSPITGGVTRPVDMKTGSAVPAGARAALLTLTAVNTSTVGFLAAFKGGIAWPNTSTLNWDHAQQVIATTTVSAVSTTGIMNVYCSSGSSTDFVVDVIGFYA